MPWKECSVIYDLGFIDLEQKTLQPLDNQFGPRLSPMSPGRTKGFLVVDAVS